MSNIHLIPLQKEHLDIVFTWRNMPDVRKNMYTSHEITFEEHKNWFERISLDKTKKYFVFQIDEKPCGVIGFTDINLISKTSSWAFYSGDTTIRGIGSLMEITALDYAFDVLKIEKLHCEVLEFNQPVIKFHRKHGFTVEGVFKKHHYANEKYWDIFRLAIFKKDWLKVKPEIVERAKGPFSTGKTFRHQFQINSNQVQEFSKVSGDNNKIHFDDATAKKYGFDKAIVHGFLVTSIFSKLFGRDFTGEGTIYLNQFMKFHAPVYAEDKLEATLKVLSKIGQKLVVSTEIKNITTDLVVVSGEAEILIPKSN